MADSYSRWVMTDAFANNSQAAINAGQKIEWVSIKTSDDSHTFNDLSGFNDTTLATATIRQTTNISSVTITGKTVTITGLFNSNNNTADYYIRTMFLVARYNGKEFLAGATVANSSSTAFRMPAASGTEITEFTARPQISVSNTSTISATVNPVASATNERVDALEADTQAKIDYLTGEKDMLWDRFKDFVTKATAETVTGVKTFTQTIVGSITGNAGTATKLQTGRRINGTVFDGTADINVPASNDSNLVHKSGDEVVNGGKTFVGTTTFNKPIDGYTKTKLAPSTDLDLITQPGKYGILDSFTNQPNTHTTYKLLVVEKSIHDEVIYQTLYGRRANKSGTDVHFRSTYSGAWTPWIKMAPDEEVMHLFGDETVAGFKKFSGNIATTSDNSMINGGGNNGDIALVKKLGLSGFLALGSNNTSLCVKSSNNASISPSDTFTDIFTVDKSGNVKAGAQQDLLPLDKNVVHKSGAEDIAGPKRFTGDITFDLAINGRLAVRTDLPADLNMLNRYVSAGVYIVSVTNLVNQPAAHFGILKNIVLPSGTTYQEFVDIEASVVYMRNYASARGTWSSWSRIADDATVIHIGENAASATKLKTIRRIGGVNFDGTTDINLPGVNTAGNQNTSGNAATATKLQTGRLVGGVSFDGTKDIVLPGVNAKGNQDTSGRAANADLANKAIALDTPRKINGTFFDGTTDINVPASNDSDIVHKSGNEDVNGDKTFKGNVSFTKLINGYTKTLFAPNTDLDLITTPGKYGILDSYTNQPNTHTTYKLLIVDKSVHDEVIYQTLYERRWGGNTTDIYIRSTFSGVWNAWAKLPHDNEVVHIGDNASSATKLQTPRKINGTNFDGTADINVNAANDANLVHKSGAEVVGGDKEFTGTTTLAKAVSKSVVKKTMTAQNIVLDFTETATGVNVYAHSATNTGFVMDNAWHTLGTMPVGITRPYDIVIVNSSEAAGIGGVTVRTGFNVKVAIKPSGEMTYKFSSLREGDSDTTRRADVSFDAYTSWFK